MHSPDFSFHFVLQIDMLDGGLGAVLSQVVEEEGITGWYLALQPFKYHVIQRMVAVADFLFRNRGSGWQAGCLACSSRAVGSRGTWFSICFRRRKRSGTQLVREMPLVNENYQVFTFAVETNSCLGRDHMESMELL